MYNFFFFFANIVSKPFETNHDAVHTCIYLNMHVERKLKKNIYVIHMCIFNHDNAQTALKLIEFKFKIIFCTLCRNDSCRHGPNTSCEFSGAMQHSSTLRTIHKKACSKSRKGYHRCGFGIMQSSSG